MPERVAFWPRGSALFIADLHLGKANTLAAGLGAAVPETVLRGVVREDLARLGRALAATGAERVIIVGDLLHAPIGTTEDLIDEVAVWRAMHPQPWIVIRGNHDGKVGRVGQAWKLTLAGEELDEPPFRFVHIPPRRSHPGAFLVCGHEHPAVTIGRSGRGGPGSLIKLPAFLIGRDRMILPAMSRFTAGGSVPWAAGTRHFACGPGEVFEVPEHGLACR